MAAIVTVSIDAAALVAQRLLLFGVGPRSLLEQSFCVYAADGAILSNAPTVLRCYRREDIAAPDVAGFVMVFGLSGTDDVPALLYGDTGGEAAFELVPFASVLAGADDAAFLTLLAFVSDGILPSLHRQAASLASERASRIRRDAVRAETCAGAFDEVLCAHQAGLFASGWVLSTNDTESVNVGLVVLTEQSAQPLSAIHNVIARPDLASVGPQYRVRANDGFVAYATTIGDEAATTVMVLTLGEEIHATRCPVSPCSIDALTTRFEALSVALSAQQDAQCRRALTARLKRTGGAGTRLSGRRRSSRPLVVLQHDGRMRDLREVLATLAAWCNGFDLILADRRVGPEAEHAILGAQRDAGADSVRLIDPANAAGTLMAAATAERPLICVRSALVFQSEELAWLLLSEEAPARVLVHHHVPTCASDLNQAVAAIVREDAPFALGFSANAALAELIERASSLCSLPGRLLWAVLQVHPDNVAYRPRQGNIFTGDPSPREEGLRRPSGRTRFEADAAAIAAHIFDID